MSCGEQYKDLLNVSGFTPDSPCAIVGCTGEIAQAYNARADEIKDLATMAWNALLEVGGQPSDDPALMQQVDGFWAGWEAMPRWHIPDVIEGLQMSDEELFFFNSNIVDKSLEVMREGICVLQLLNDKYEAIKGEGSGVDPAHTPPPPKPEDTAVGQIAGAIKAVVVGGVIIAVIFAAVKLAK